MALVGGGGAGNVAGSNPAGIGSGLNYIGNKVYSYSGVFGASSSFTEKIDFTTGATPIDAAIQCIGFANPADTGPGVNSIFTIKFDGQVIGYVKVETANEAMPSLGVVNVVIPSYTHVQVGVITDQNDANKQGAVIMAGEMF